MNNRGKLKQGRFRQGVKANFHHGNRQPVQQAAQWDCVVTIPGVSQAMTT